MEHVALVVGESLVDVVRGADGSLEEHPGGSAANVAVALARLGRPTWFASAWADDSHGRLVADHLAADGVRLASGPHVVARTSVARATLSADGSASYEFDLDWRLGPVDLEGHEPLVVHVCSLGAVLDPGAETVRDLVARLRGQATISYDVNVRPAVTGTGPGLRDRVERLVALCDVVKASDEDLGALYPDLALDAAADRLLGLGPLAVLVTRGADGATWFGQQGRGSVAGVQTTVVDTIGAGDTLSAATLDGLWSTGVLGAARRPELARLADSDWSEVLSHGVRAAGVTVSRAGADPPYRDELP